MDSVLSPEKVAELRRAVDRTLRDANVYNKVREVLAEHTARDGTLGTPSTDRILGLVQEKGVLSSLIDSVGTSGSAAAAAGTAATSSSSSPLTASASRGLSGERHLHVRMLGGRAFLEHLDCDPVATTTLSSGGAAAAAAAGGDVLVAHVQFGTQRFVSEEVPCLCDPDFADSFLVGLDAELQAQQRTNAALTRHSGSRDLLRLTTQLHVVVLRVNRERQTRRLVGENTVEWRGVLRTGTLGVSVEVGGGGQAAGGVPVGVLELQLELLPAQATLGDEEVADQLAAERSNAVASEREFLVYARRWWGEYLATSEAFQRRHVKVFASVQAHAARAACVTAFVAPLRADRVLASPLLSARYVSLLTYDKDDPAAALPLTAAAGGGGGGSGVGPAAWAPLFPFVATGKGGEAEHANLLCSLLLGHGLDAWVVLGVDAANRHKTCVVTRAGELAAGAPPPLRSSHLVTYWDVLTGVRYKVPNPHATGVAAADAVGCNDVALWEGGMAAVHCAYTADAFVANVQGEASVQATSFDFSSEEQWKSMNPIKLRMVQKSPVPALLRPHAAGGGAAAVEALEQRLERAVVERIAAYRGDLGFPTLWDHDTLPHILSQALYNYEHQKVTNVALDASMFQCAIKGAIRKGQHCKAFPVNFTHSSPSRIFKHFVSNRHTSDIIELVGDNVRHSLRVKITPYAEEAHSVWVMLAAVYSS